MTDDLPGPSPGELRAASASLMAAHFAASLFSRAVKAEADRQQYLVDAQTVGVDQQEAERVLTEARDELLHAGHSPHLAYRIAWRRLLEQPGERPPEHVRDAARQVLRLAGEPYDPESVDRLARTIEALHPPEHRPLTAEQAVQVVATMAECVDGGAGQSRGQQSRHRRRREVFLTSNPQNRPAGAFVQVRYLMAVHPGRKFDPWVTGRAGGWMSRRRPYSPPRHRT